MSRRTVSPAPRPVIAAGLVPPRALAQPAPIKLGTLTPLTGAGGSYGPRCARRWSSSPSEVNAAGGVLGRQIQLVSEDDQTSPEAAVRAARKLIDVDRVVAVMGTWASAVTTAVAPLCWESKTFLDHGVGLGHDHPAAAPGLPDPHAAQHPICRCGKLGEFLISLKVKRVFVLAAQTPFALPSQKRLTEILPKGGGEVVGAVIYDKDKTTFRSEIDQALRAKPRHDLPQRLHAGLHRADEGALQGRLRRRQGGPGLRREPEAARLDARRGERRHSPRRPPPRWSRPATSARPSSSGPATSIRIPASATTTSAWSRWPSPGPRARPPAPPCATRCGRFSQGPGTKVDSAVEGLKLLAQGKEINFEGASGPCDFTDIGDILDCQIRYEQARAASSPS